MAAVCHGYACACVRRVVHTNAYFVFGLQRVLDNALSLPPGSASHLAGGRGREMKDKTTAYNHTWLKDQSSHLAPEKSLLCASSR